MDNSSNITYDGVAITERRAFSRTASIGILIESQSSKVWQILTNASAYIQWNSTLISLDGMIAEGETIKLKSTIDPKRSFKLKIIDVDPISAMTWKGNIGLREFKLKERDDQTMFYMKEKIGGPLYPLFAKMIPPFDEAFETFAKDLKAFVEKS